MPLLAWAVSRALLSVQQVLLRTYLHMREQESTANSQEMGPDIEIKEKARLLRLRELRLVPERGLISDGGEGWHGRPVAWDAMGTS